MSGNYELVPQEKQASIVSSEAAGKPFGIYGWRKRLFCAMIVFIAVIVLANLGLTIWLFYTLDISYEGTGSLRFDDSGVRVLGDYKFEQRPSASGLMARGNDGLLVNTGGSVSVVSKEDSGNDMKSEIHYSEHAEIKTAHFQITNAKKQTLFCINKEEMSIGPNGISPNTNNFRSALQTAQIKSPSTKDLRLRSRKQSLRINAIDGTRVESNIADLSLSSQDEIKLEAKNGVIELNTSKIEMNGLYLKNNDKRQGHDGMEITSRQNGMSSKIKDSSVHNDKTSYQICVCHNGKIFLAVPDNQCTASETACL